MSDVRDHMTLDRASDLFARLPRTEYVERCLQLMDSKSFLDFHKLPLPSFQQRTALFAIEYLSYSLLRKYPFKGIDRRSAALSTFVRAEAICRETNQRLSRIYQATGPGRNHILWLRRKIDTILGRFPGFDAIERSFAFGPGATTRLKNCEGDVYFKFRGKPETTMSNLHLARAAIGRIPNWFGAIAPHRVEDLVYVVPGSKVTTVPKDAKTDRTIAIEPCMNLFIQRGLGTAIRDRLRRVSVDLTDQQRNQKLAELGSRDRLLATIDLSMASDTVSLELVRLLLPDDWLEALEQCRSPRYVLDSKVYTFEKFSTMGNGYTFELESLIFYAIASLACSLSGVGRAQDVSVYGDDIILPSQAVGCLYELLSLFGFVPNTEKSYSGDNPFRESCGKHFLRGAEVTPVYIRDPLRDARATGGFPVDMFWFCNSVVRWVERTPSVLNCGFDVVDFAVNCIESVPQAYRLLIPDHMGDGGFFLPSWILDSLPQGLRDDLRRNCDGPKSRRLKRSYQHGYSFRHVCVRNVWPADRDPSDVPYLLRHLYNLERSQREDSFRSIYGRSVTKAVVGVTEEYFVATGTASSWDY